MLPQRLKKTSEKHCFKHSCLLLSLFCTTFLELGAFVFHSKETSCSIVTFKPATRATRANFLKWHKKVAKFVGSESRGCAFSHKQYILKCLILHVWLYVAKRFCENQFAVFSHVSPGANSPCLDPCVTTASWLCECICFCLPKQQTEIGSTAENDFKQSWPLFWSFPSSPHLHPLLYAAQRTKQWETEMKRNGKGVCVHVSPVTGVSHNANTTLDFS